MAGEYRAEAVLMLMRGDLSAMLRCDIRIALTTQPLRGVSTRSDLTEVFAAEYERIGMPKYSEGLRNGDMIIIQVPPERPSNRYWRPGELFFGR